VAKLRRRLAAAKDALAEAQAAMKRAEATYDAATEAEQAQGAAREYRARAREARQAHERAAATVARLQRRVNALTRHRIRDLVAGWARSGLTGGPYPKRCRNGHEWGPGRMLVTWKRCSCPGAQTLHPDQAIWGHFIVACRERGCRSVWYDPPHEPGG